MEAIQEAIRQLPEPARRKLADWFEELEAQAWDEQIERDFSPGGRGMRFLAEVKSEIAERKGRPMEEGFAEFRKSRL